MLPFMQIMQAVGKVGLLDIKCRDQIERLMRTASLSLLLPSFFTVASANPYGIFVWVGKWVFYSRWR